MRTTSFGNNYGFEISIAQQDRRLLERLKGWLVEGTIVYKKTPKAKKPVYQFTVRKRLAVWKILKMTRPHLIVKAEVADRLFSYFTQTYGSTR